MALVGDGRENSCDQFGVRRERQIFLGSCPDGIDRAARVGSDTAGHDGGADAFGGECANQAADIERDIAQHQVGAAAGAQLGERLFEIGCMRDFRPAVHGDLGGRADLALQTADDE